MLKTILCLFIILGTSFSDSVGDTCYLGSDVGVCQPITDCPSVLRDREKHKKQPQICGFQKLLPIVCCPDQRPLAPTAPAPVAAPTPTSSRVGDASSYCEKYSQFAYERIVIPNTNETIREARCGIFSMSFEGRKSIQPKEFPHFALIGADTPGGVKYFCSGALISDVFVITSAHCVHQTSAQYVKIPGDKPEYFTVRRAITHPKYTNASFYNDVGLIELNRPANFTPFVRPACLPPLNYNVQNVEDFVTASWEAVGTQGNYVKIRLSRVLERDCDKAYANLTTLPQGINHRNQICTTIRGQEPKNCQLNVGGPLHVPHTAAYCSYLVLGITSFAKTCGFTEPVVFTSFLPYLDWIAANVYS